MVAGGGAEKGKSLLKILESLTEEIGFIKEKSINLFGRGYSKQAGTGPSRRHI